MARPPLGLVLAAMLLLVDTTGGGASRAAANPTKASAGAGGGGATCARPADCPAQQHCNDSYSCYECSYSYITATCDAVDGDCCSAAFRTQCPSNPHGCTGLPEALPDALASRAVDPSAVGAWEASSSRSRPRPWRPQRSRLRPPSAWV